MAPESKTLQGGCHCKYIRYEVVVTPDDNGTFTALRCNCTFCTKLANTNLHYHDPSNFKLLSPANRAEISGYAVNNPDFPRYFCHKCGAHVFMEGKYDFPMPDGTVKQMQHCSVNLPTIDQPQDDFDLSKVKIKYWDGLNNNFGAGLKDTPWSNGCV